MGGASIGGYVEARIGDEVKRTFKIDLSNKIGHTFSVDGVISGATDGSDFVTLVDQFFSDLVPALGGQLFVGVARARLDDDLVVRSLVDGRHQGSDGDSAFVPGIEESAGGLDFVNAAEKTIVGGIESLGQAIGCQDGEPLFGAGKAEAEGGFDLTLEIEADVEMLAAEGGEHSELGEPGSWCAAVAFPMFGIGKDDFVNESGAVNDGGKSVLYSPGDVGLWDRVSETGEGPGSHDAVTHCAKPNDQNFRFHKSPFRRALRHRSCIQSH